MYVEIAQCSRENGRHELINKDMDREMIGLAARIVVHPWPDSEV
jgi:hypothetical protein